MAEKETVAVQQADAKQSSEEATKKRGWNIDYSQYKIPEGTTVEKARVFTFNLQPYKHPSFSVHLFPSFHSSVLTYALGL
jgi:hypothetical protein